MLSPSAFSFAPVFLDMCCISAEGGGVFISPIPINYLHVKYIAPLLRLASELSAGRAEESDAQSGIEFPVLSSDSPFRFHALAGTLKVMVH